MQDLQETVVTDAYAVVHAIAGADGFGLMIMLMMTLTQGLSYSNGSE